mgnify:FL=1
MKHYFIRNIIILQISVLSTLSGSVFQVLNGQEVIGGIVNSYAKVTSIGPGFVIVSDPAQAAQFSPNDYVLLIQMQGVGIQTVQGSYGENVQSVFGTPGGYEFLVVQSVNIVTGRIDFTRNTYVSINGYSTNSNLQLIRIPFYKSPEVASTVTCQPWDPSTGTGGVVAFLAGGKLTLNADIDVTGRGFSGAQGSAGIGECVFTNESANNHDSYPLSWNNAGLKGEGISVHDYTGALLYPNHAKGQGRNFSGGGGGNGRYSGGGGGSNRGKGGDGGLEKYIPGQCGDDPRDGGFGGMGITGTAVEDGIFAGGGGGASTQSAGSTASAGGNGGGIVIIIADTIDARNHFIRASGATAQNAVSDAGAGGGGAGGSIALSFQNLFSFLGLAAAGGNGGTNPGGFGQGGGGGGGLIWLSPATLPAAVSSANVAGGTSGAPLAGGDPGEIRANYFPALNGFLFNSIRTAATNNMIDSVCSDTNYGLIIGSQPVGGTPPYTFEWQSSVTSPSGGFTTAPGNSSQKNYTPPSRLTATTWFRRVVRDYGATITDISMPVMVEVHPAIRNNIIGDPGILCYGQIPDILHSVQPLQDGNGKYEFIWESSTDNITYTGTGADDESYQAPSGLTQTTWYRRRVFSGACVSTSDPVRISVLPGISNNTISSDPQEICFGENFTNLQGSVAPILGGGDNNYIFRWERSADGATWVEADGSNNDPDYNPSESAPYFPGQQYFRRVVLSGANNVCVNESAPVLLSSYPPVTNNTILPFGQTICAGTIPALLAGSLPLNGKGPGTYIYTWQDSTRGRTWRNIDEFTNVTSPDYAPPALTDSTFFRRIVHSSVCTSYSEAVSINVHSPVRENNLFFMEEGPSDTIICAGSLPNRLIGSQPSGGTEQAGDFTYQWSSSPDNRNWTDIQASGTSRDYQPQTLTTTTYFRRRATSGMCSSESGPLLISVLPVISNNSISEDQVVCMADVPGILGQTQGMTLSGGSGVYTFLWEESTDGINWTPAAGTNNNHDGSYQPPVMTGDIRYRRNVASGKNKCCQSVSNIVELVMDKLPDDYIANAGKDTVIFSLDNIFSLSAGPAVEGGSGKWTVLQGSGSFQNDTFEKTEVSGLSPGLNRFLWTVTRGACTVSDIVEINVNELFIPEGFSPNNDPEGYNNTFEIKGLDLDNQIVELTIVNSAGSGVFSASNRNGSEWHAWDGKNSRGRDLPEGTYYYLLRITSTRTSQLFKKSGFVILKRY